MDYLDVWDGMAMQYLNDTTSGTWRMEDNREVQRDLERLIAALEALQRTAE